MKKQIKGLLSKKDEMLPYLSLTKEQVCTLLESLAPEQFQEVARVVWTLTKPKEALLTYASRLDFPDGCDGQFVTGLGSVLTAIAEKVDALESLGYRLVLTCDIGLNGNWQYGGGFYPTQPRYVAIQLVRPEGRVNLSKFERESLPFNIDIQEYLAMDTADKLHWMFSWCTYLRSSLKSVIDVATQEKTKTTHGISQNAASA